MLAIVRPGCCCRLVWNHSSLGYTVVLFKLVGLSTRKAGHWIQQLSHGAAPANDSNPGLLLLPQSSKIGLTIPMSTPWPERGFSMLKRIKASTRNRLLSQTVNTLVNISSINGQNTLLVKESLPNNLRVHDNKCENIFSFLKMPVSWHIARFIFFRWLHRV